MPQCNTCQILYLLKKGIVEQNESYTNKEMGVEGGNSFQSWVCSENLKWS
jgi:hypothetical protein